MRKSISEATAGEVREFCRVNQGLDVSDTHKKDHMVGLLRASGYSLDEIDVPDEASQTPAPKVESIEGEKHDRPGLYYVQAMVRGKEQRRAYINIMIPESGGPGGSEPVPVACNGKQVHLPRNSVVAVPIEHVEVLDNAEELIRTPAADDNGNSVIHTRRVKVFPYQTMPAGLENADAVVNAKTVAADAA